MNIQDLLEIIALGVKMRDAQKRYFRTRNNSDLQDAKMYEREFDEKAKEVLSDGCQ